MAPKNVTNLFAKLPSDPVDEVVDRLVTSQRIRIERIVSTGQCSQTGFWYDQGEHEWVVVLTGRARLLFEGDDEALSLAPGDHVHIPAHRRHRVEWTKPDEPTVWLAVFYSADEEN